MSLECAPIWLVESAQNVESGRLGELVVLPHNDFYGARSRRDGC